MEQYALVNDNGCVVDFALLKEDEVSSRHIHPNWDKRLFQPKWDFKGCMWVEGLSSEEVKKREGEIEKSKSELNIGDKNSIAILELAESIIKIGVK